MATRLLSNPAALLRWTNAARRTADKLVRVIARLLLPSARDAAQVFDIAKWMAAWEALVSAGETMIPSQHLNHIHSATLSQSANPRPAAHQLNLCASRRCFLQLLKCGSREQEEGQRFIWFLSDFRDGGRHCVQAQLIVALLHTSSVHRLALKARAAQKRE